MVFDARGNGDGKTVCTLTGDHQNRVTGYTALAVGNGPLNQMSMAEQSNTLDTMHDHQAIMMRTGREEGGDAIMSVVRRLTPLE
jgi:DNA (cytosine-5)-methyltransferase 1